MMPTVHDGDRLLYNPFFKNVEPVSYTHLDVYKRQHDYMLSEIQREITENLEKNKDIVSVDGFSAKVAVSYTHL